ncbi:ECF transporter S component [Bacillus massilinigeriensis]|uniref:ECF transporter S component n=1 Tax=Bacillus massilionigeriensis TaxID=1805475 RepID=UPI00096B4D05|nr:ECF transporter S component [Bacillus massilionigeriensis]
MKGKHISWLAMFIALSVVGAMIKIPAVITSVAFDSFPALLASALLGSPYGAVVAGAGHLLSALFGGMPLGPLHALIAVEMAILAWIFALFYQRGKKYIASILFLLGNTFVAPLPFIFLLGTAFYVGMIPSLLLGSLVNTIVALILIPRLQTIFTGAFGKKAEAKS